jgi:hypothetical protein
MTHSEFYYNLTSSVSVSNWCGFCYTSYKTYSEYSLTQGHTFSSISSRGILCLIDIFNYFSVIYVCNTYVCQNIMVTDNKSGWILLEHTWASDSWSTMNLFHLIDLSLVNVIFLFPISSPLTLKTGQIWCACILYFSTSFLSMTYATIMLPL